MIQQKYPYKSPFFRCLNLIFRKLPNKYTLHFHGILLKKTLGCQLPAFEAKGHTFKQADMNDIKSICKNPETPYYEAYKDRLLRGHICFCALDRNEIMCYVWFCYKTCGLFFGTKNEVEFLPLKDFQVYSYNLYTYKKFRQKGIASQLHKFCNISLRNNGIKERLCVIGPSFVGSMKISLSNGFKPKRMIYVYGFKNLKKVFLGSTNHVSKLNLWKKWFEATYGIKNTTC